MARSKTVFWASILGSISLSIGLSMSGCQSTETREDSDSSANQGLERGEVTAPAAGESILPLPGEPNRVPIELRPGQRWGETPVTSYEGRIHFSPVVPDDSLLREAKAKGVKVVIDLRTPAELSGREKQRAEALGLAYRNVPVSPSEAFSLETLTRIENAVSEAGGDGGSALMHCKSGSRAGAWLAIHLANDRGLSEADAIAMGRQAGLTDIMVPSVHQTVKAKRTEKL